MQGAHAQGFPNPDYLSPQDNPMRLVLLFFVFCGWVDGAQDESLAWSHSSGKQEGWDSDPDSQVLYPIRYIRRKTGHGFLLKTSAMSQLNVSSINTNFVSVYIRAKCFPPNPQHSL